MRLTNQATLTILIWASFVIVPGAAAGESIHPGLWQIQRPIEIDSSGKVLKPQPANNRQRQPVAPSGLPNSSVAFVKGLALVRQPGKKSLEVVDTKGDTISSLPVNFKAEDEPMLNPLGWRSLMGNGLVVGFISKDDRPENSTESCVKQHAVFNAREKRLLDTPEGFTGLIEFHEDRGIFGCGKQYGFMDPNGKIVIEAKYDYVLPFSEGLAPVYDERGWKYIDKLGHTRITMAANCSGVERFSEGLAPVIMGGEPSSEPLIHWKGSRLGYIDKTGKMAIAPRFYSGLGGGGADFVDGRAIVAEAGKSVHKYGLIDRAGNWVIKPTYARFEHFFGGRAWVTPVTPFNSNAWKSGPQYSNRREQFNQFLTEYHLIGATRQSLVNLLGPPDEGEPGTDIYLMGGGCLGKPTLSIEYSDGKAARYRFNDTPLKAWYDAQHPYVDD